jgi:hypothetical protein
MNRQYLVKSISTSFPTEWHNATKFGGNQEGAKSYHPLLVFVNEMKLLCHTWGQDH